MKRRPPKRTASGTPASWLLAGGLHSPAPQLLTRRPTATTSVALRCTCGELLDPVRGAGERLVGVARTCSCGAGWRFELRCTGYQDGLPRYELVSAHRVAAEAYGG